MIFYFALWQWNVRCNWVYKYLIAWRVTLQSLLWSWTSAQCLSQGRDLFTFVELLFHLSILYLHLACYFFSETISIYLKGRNFSFFAVFYKKMMHSFQNSKFTYFLACYLAENKCYIITYCIEYSIWKLFLTSSYKESPK
jgi:hypothetical protein